MNDWTAGIGEAVSYIENNLDGEINIEKAAEKAFVSTFYFQKIFCVLCGFTIGEYIYPIQAAFSCRRGAVARKRKGY